MGLPAIEADVLARRFEAEFTSGKAPYYGINVIEVNAENWDIFIKQTKSAHAGVVAGLGGRSHLWSVRDYGDRKRVLWINYYSENVGHLNTFEIFQTPSVRDYWHKHISLVERWDWHLSSEDPCEAPI